MSGQNAEENSSGEPKQEKQEWMSRPTRRIVGETIILLIYLAIDVVEVWPLSHCWALASGVAGVSALAFMELPTPYWAVSTAMAALCAFGIFVFTPQVNPLVPVPPKLPFAVVTSEKLRARTFPHGPDPNPPIFAYAVDRGALIAGAAQNGPSAMVSQGVDLLMYVTITNRSGTPRRVTEYNLDVGGSASGPWTAMCPVNFKFFQMYFVGNAKEPFQWPADEMLDSKLTEHSLQPGDTFSGWAGWICPLAATDECRPAYLRYTLTDSLGVESQYVESNAQADATRPHDWMTDATIMPIKATRNFVKGSFIEGNCPKISDGEILPIPPDVASAPK